MRKRRCLEPKTRAMSLNHRDTSKTVEGGGESGK